MIRGRLLAINGKPVAPDDLRRRARQAPGRARVQPQPRGRACRRTTQVVGGRWVAEEPGAISVEEGLADDARPEARRPAALRRRRAAPSRAASPACARSTGARCGSTSSSCSRPRRLADVPVSYIAAFRRRPPARAAGADAGLRQRAQPRISEHHQRRRLGLDRPGAARARPGDPRGRVPVRLHAGRRAGGAVRRDHRHARGAGARVRGDARARRQRHACWRRCSAPSCSASARWPACWRRWRRSRSAGRWRATSSSSSWNASPWVPLAGGCRRRAAGARRRLVGPARGAAPPGGGDAAHGRAVAVRGAAPAHGILRPAWTIWPHDRCGCCTSKTANSITS